MKKMTFLGCAMGVLNLPLNATDLLLGHFEVQVDYQYQSSAPNSGWQVSVSYDEDDNFTDQVGVQRLNPNQTRLVVTPSSQRIAPSNLSAFVATEQPMWLLSQVNQAGQLFLGWRAIYQAGQFQALVGNNYSPSTLGSISGQMMSVTGSGPDRGGKFAMWTAGGFGALEYHFNTADGITAADRLAPVRAGSHSHYNWGFTQPGSYQVRFRYAGRLNPQFGGQDVATEQDFRFAVPFSGELRSGDALRLGQVCAWHDPEYAVEYALDQSALVTESLTEAGQNFPYAAKIRFETGQNAAPSRVGLSGSTPIALASGHSLASDPLEILEIKGPGSLTVSPLASGERLFQFSQSGIYRVKARARSLMNGQPQLGPVFELVCLAGLPMNYTYAQWADSFERTQQLASGSLASPTADWDKDGVCNGLEYQLFWHGLSPVKSDSHLLPKPEIRDGFAEIVFLRDFHKDDLFQSPLELSAAHSPNLKNPWQPWRRLVAEGEPEGFYEDGAERGNEVGVVMRRVLRVPQAESHRAFFRFELRLR